MINNNANCILLGVVAILLHKKKCNESYKLYLEEENGLQIIGFCLQKNPTMQPWQHVIEESNHGSM